MIGILLGPPGVGKGTQARNLALRRGLKSISTGEVMRAEVAAGTPLGKQARSYMEAGNLVPDEIVLAMVKALMEVNPGGEYLLDGFPRTMAQATGLDGILARLGRRVDMVINMTIPEEVVVRRLADRRTCPVDGRVYNLASLPPRVPGRCDDHPDAELVFRTDDQPETVRQRFVVYRAQTAPLIEFYRERGLLRDVDADGTVEEVVARVEAALG